MTETREYVFHVRVYYEDTDAGGVVYYANYLRFAERARTELLRAMGIDHRTLLADDGIMFAVRRCEADYVKPARLDDLLEVRTRFGSATGASFWMEQEIRRDDEILTDLKLRLVCIRPDGRPARLPDAVRELAASDATQTTH
jgi:acyl-CoA thioester hydrolase